METALVLGLGTFTACWLLHVVIWRIHRPEAYPIWLPIIFLLMPVVAASIFMLAGGTRPLSCDLSTVITAFLLHAAVSACYMGGYAGVIEYSPSAEILRAVRQKMPDGVEPEALHVPSLSEQALTGKRITHLVTSRMAISRNGSLELTPRGKRVVRVCRLYRQLFGLKEDAKG